MRSRIIGIVLIVVSIGVDIWLGTALASGARATGVSLAFVLISLPFLAVGVYFLLTGRGEVKAESSVDKERAILNSVMTRGKVSIPDLAIEGNLTRDQVKDYIYDLIGKDLKTATPFSLSLGALARNQGWPSGFAKYCDEISRLRYLVNWGLINKIPQRKVLV